MKLAFIGFGEAAMTFAASISRDGLDSLVGYDIKSVDSSPTVRRQKSADYAGTGVVECLSLQQAIADADVVMSLVTADQAGIVAGEAAALVKSEGYFLDANSCSPSTKKRSARSIDGAGGRYVDVAIMAPVAPQKNRTPLLLSGEYAERGRAILEALNMAPVALEGEVGAACAIKMIRSIMVKGLEALTAECVLAGRLMGVDAQVFDSLGASHPEFDWPRQAAYALERMTRHGRRRAAEMTEVTQFLHDLGFRNTMSASTAKVQEAVGRLGLSDAGENYQAAADQILKRLLGSVGVSSADKQEFRTTI